MRGRNIITDSCSAGSPNLGAAQDADIASLPGAAALEMGVGAFLPYSGVLQPVHF